MFAISWSHSRLGPTESRVISCLNEITDIEHVFSDLLKQHKTFCKIVKLTDLAYGSWARRDAAHQSNALTTCCTHHTLLYETSYKSWLTQGALHSSLFVQAARTDVTAGAEVAPASRWGGLTALAVEFITLGRGSRNLGRRVRGHLGTPHDRVRGCGGRVGVRGCRSHCGA